MCGRYSFSTSKEKIKEQLPEIETGENLRNSFNIAPTQHAYVITNNKPDKLQYFTWGLVPYWSRDGKNSGKLINARSEGIEVKPSFRVPIRQRRCVVLADSFYEWRRIGKNKVPYRIFLKDGKLLEMAGVFDIWQKGNLGHRSFSIITISPNQEMSSLHSRMPVIFENGEDRNKWLDSNLPLEEALSLLKTPSNDILKYYRVSEKLNSPKNNSADLHQELPELPSLF